MAQKKVPTQTEAVEQVNQISANNPNSKPDMVDPIVYREDYMSEDITGFDPKKLANADVNISQYGDDSSAKNYNNSQLWGGENQKYSGENTKNSQVSYNKNATLEGLDPNYKYGQAAQMANSEEANYIARRNDEIASALYNAGKTSMEDVANFLNQQKGFDNSVGNERQNTILSVWKRLGDIAKENQNNNAENTKGDNSPSDASNEAVNNMESDLNESTAGKIYGKVTADESDVISTLQDENSVYRAMNEARIRSFKDMQAMSSDSIAASIVSGVMASDTQTMRDLMQYDPAKYQEVQNQIKALRGQMNINAISSGEGEWNTSATNGQGSLSNEKADFVSSYNGTNTNTADLLQSVNSSLSSNVAASSAQEQLTSIENDMSNLQNRMKNLKAEAKSVFKGDVPQYIVNAYIANRRQEIQDQLSVLETRYNAAYSRYQDEWERTKWDAEFGLKQQQIQNQASQQNIDNYFKQQQIDIAKYELKLKYGQNSNKTQTEIDGIIDNLVEQCENGELGNAQCAAGIQKYYLPSLGVEFGSLSSYSSKQNICNETDLANYQPKKGDLVVMSSPTKPENGHIGIVIGVDSSTGTLKYMDWNGSVKDGVGTETAEVRSTTLSNSKIYGYYNPTKNAQSIGGNGTAGYNENFADIYSKFLQGQMYTEGRLNTAIKSVGARDENELRNQALAWRESQKSNESAMMMLNAVEYLMSQGANKFQRQLAINDGNVTRGIGDVAGGIDRFFRGDAANYNSYYKYIKDNFTLDHLVDLKNNGATFGALSNQELDAISSSALALASDMGEEQFNAQLFIIYNKLRKNVGESQLTRKQFDEMIGAEDDKNKQQYYLALYNPEKITEDPNEVLPEENF